jgi:hypothetical protein
MKVVLACPIRDSSGGDNQQAKDYIAELKQQGHDVFSYWDTDMADCPTGANILETHLKAVRECEEFHVFWSEKSRGVHWETATAVALDKKIVIVELYSMSPEGQSYLRALCQRPEVEWRVKDIPRPAIVE